VGKRMVRRLDVDGDEQGDRIGHGGEQRAVFVYQIDSYRYWEGHLHRNDFVLGQFGENFTVEGLSDAEVCIGDRYRIGSALFEVTQPRVTCYRVGIRMAEPRMPSLLYSHRRPGFYFRVLQEGEVQAGDEIVKVADGPERMSVADVCALLYLPGHPRQGVERALRIPALSAGWQGSFRALLEQTRSEHPENGNRGLAAESGAPPEWSGFRPLIVEEKHRESKGVVSLVLRSADERALPAARAGQFIVVRLQPLPDAPPLMRSFSLSGGASTTRYRISVKRENQGAASAYLCDDARVGDVFDVSAPRGAFTPRSQPGPTVFLSAGIGATPVLAMLHALANASSTQQVWWLYGARNGEEHPFAQESRDALQALPNARSWIVYSRPNPADRLGVDFDAQGHLSITVLAKLGVPSDAQYYLCGAPSFLHDLTEGLARFGVPNDRVHTEIFGPGTSLTPGVVGAAHRPPHPLPGPSRPGPRISFARSGIEQRWDPSFQSLLELAEACDVPVRWSCRVGACHTCESGLVAGTVGYQPEPLDRPADGNVLICCSQPRDDVVIDL
jgi:ferredoxin-NADP reductase/MOSC domain-containing protein YiiM